MPVIPEERKHVFNSTAYMIERKLLDLQTYIVAHRYPLRFVCFEYKNPLTEKELGGIEKGINKMYDLLETFCNEYAVHKMPTSMRSELMVKANFLWEDLCGAISLRGYGKIDEPIVSDYTEKINAMIRGINEVIEDCKKLMDESTNAIIPFGTNSE